MSFPGSPLPVLAEVFVDGAWAGITDRVYTRDPITIARGRANEATQVEASSCELTLDNRDGRFSPRNPASPYYGKIGRNTPLRVRLGQLVTEGFEDATLDITVTNAGDVAWARSNNQAHTGTWSFRSGLLTLGQTSDAVVTVPAGTRSLDFWWLAFPVNSGTFTVLVDAAEVLTYSGDNQVAWQRSIINVAGAGTVTFRLERTSAAAQPLAYVDDIEFNDVRFSGEVAAWPQQWDKPGKNVYTPIEVAGVMRRLGQGAKPLRSALYREITSRAHNGLLAYWPCEDGEGATSMASATGGPPMTIQGAPDLASYDAWAASAPLPTMGTGSFNGTVPLYTPTGETLAWALVVIPTAGAATGQLMGVRTTGTANLWTVEYVAGTGGRLAVHAFDAEGTEIHDSGDVTFGVDGDVFSMALELVQNGADVDYRIIVYKIFPDGTFDGSFFGATVTSRTVGRALRISAAGNENQTDTVIGHIALANETTFFAGTDRALFGWVGETAGRRVERLCAEEGVPFTSTGDLDDTAAMGPQRIDTFLDLAREAAEADLGILYEPRTILGLAYRTRASLYNQTPVLELPYAGVFGSLPEPIDDDQAVRNDITVKRPGGSEARAVLETGPLSVQAPPDGIGTYDTSVDVNVAGDAFLPDQAAWRLGLGTVNEARYPRLHLNLAADAFTGDAALTAAAAGLELGDRVTVSDPPAWLPPDVISQLAQGFKETLGNNTWDIDVNASPESPWQVGEYEAAVGGTYRYDTAGSTLAAQFVAGTDTSMSVAVNVKPLWTTAAGEFPFDIEVAGVRLTVTAISGASSPQTFTITRTPVNGIVKTIPAGTPVSLWVKARYALGG